MAAAGQGYRAEGRVYKKETRWSSGAREARKGHHLRGVGWTLLWGGK